MTATFGRFTNYGNGYGTKGRGDGAAGQDREGVEARSQDGGRSGPRTWPRLSSGVFLDQGTTVQATRRCHADVEAVG